MFHATVKKSGDEFEVEIPETEIARLGLEEGQMVVIRVDLVEGQLQEGAQKSDDLPSVAPTED